MIEPVGYLLYMFCSLNNASNNIAGLLLPDQDSVRLLAVEGCAALGKLLEPQDCVAHILPVIVNFSQVNYTPTWYLSVIYLISHIIFICRHSLVARGS